MKARECRCGFQEPGPAAEMVLRQMNPDAHLVSKADSRPEWH